MSKILFHKAVKGSHNHSASPERIGVVGRQVLQTLCQFSAEQNTLGTYRVHEIDAPSVSLARDVANKCDVFADETDVELVAAVLEDFSRCGRICVTRDGVILLTRIIENNALPSATNGHLSVGRPRHGETRKAYAARSRKHRAAFPRAEVAANALSMLKTMTTQALHGSELAEFIRREPLDEAIAMARGSDPRGNASGSYTHGRAATSASMAHEICRDDPGTDALSQQIAAVPRAIAASAGAAKSDILSNGNNALSTALHPSKSNEKPPRSAPVRYFSFRARYLNDASQSSVLDHLSKMSVKPDVTGGPTMIDIGNRLDEIGQLIVARITLELT